MLFWLFVIIAVVSFVLILISIEKDWDWEDVFGFSMVLSIICIVASLCVIASNYTGIDAEIEKYNIRYEMLVYQYDNDFYNNDNEVGKYELVKSIQEWNEDLAYKKRIQRNFWIGIYYPNIYDQFEFISLERGPNNE